MVLLLFARHAFRDLVSRLLQGWRVRTMVTTLEDLSSAPATNAVVAAIAESDLATEGIVALHHRLTRDVPALRDRIIFVSSDAGDVTRLAVAGIACPILVKPFHPSHLQDALERIGAPVMPPPPST